MPKLQKLKTFIDGEWCEPAAGEYFESTNPFTAEPWTLVPRCGAADVDRAVAAATRAFNGGAWPAMNASQRGALLRRLGDLIADNADHLAEIEVRDNGKLISEMGMQLRYIPQWYYYYGGLADKIEGSVIPIDKPETFNYTRHEPLGVCALITAWNSPLLLTAFKLAPCLAAGNTAILKPSEFTSASALEFAKLIEQAGFPKGVVNIITGYGNEVGQPLVEHPGVAKVGFTGSDRTGQRIYESAAKSLKRVSLELGGKSPNIVFDDAHVDNAVKGVISGIFAASGQTCIAGSRLLVQKSIHDEFVDKLVAFAGQAKIGDPMSTQTQVGPVATIPQYEKVLDYIDVAKNEGAQTALGGGKAEDGECARGWFVQPTIFTQVNNSMRIAQEEVFGPVLAIIPFADDDEALAIGNDVIYGLAAGVWTGSIRRALHMSDQLRAGTVWVNTYRAMSYLSPFGGYKRSGLGRENGREGILEYLQTKSVMISTAEEVPNPFIMR